MCILIPLNVYVFGSQELLYCQETILLHLFHSISLKHPGKHYIKIRTSLALNRKSWIAEHVNLFICGLMPTYIMLGRGEEEIPSMRLLKIQFYKKYIKENTLRKGILQGESKYIMK